MKNVRIADLKNNLSRHLERVRRGGQITVLDRDTPIARILPFVRGQGEVTGTERAESASQALEDLVRRGVVSAGSPRAWADWADAHAPRTRPKGSPSAVGLLIRTRRESTR
jgi:prevent-host-death family protein